jgi:hypothetical protein
MRGRGVALVEPDRETVAAIGQALVTYDEDDPTR